MARNRTDPAKSAAKRAKSKDSTQQAPNAKAAQKSARPKSDRASAAATVVTAVEIKKRDVKGKKGKVVRDSFTMPAAEYARIAELKQACLALGVPVKKSELLRAGITTLSQLAAEDLKRTVLAVESIKTGRPAGKSKTTKEIQS